jgi:glycosyltransferase involved in cell wall biosynthesis
MRLSDQLTIVIPCKNEGGIVDLTLSLLNHQSNINNVKVIVADSSTDDTGYHLDKRSTDLFNLQVIQGGLPSVARNSGADRVDTPYVLFLDADIFLLDTDLLLKCVTEITTHKLDLVTCKLRSSTGEYNYVFRFFDVLQALSKPISPFCMGGFMLIRTDVFNRLGGFNEQATVAEDFLLSKQVEPRKFKILPLHAFTTPRRFKSKGLWYMTKLLISSFIHKNNKQYFQNDKGYWK